MINIAFICKEFGWTYDDYMNQPSDFLDAIMAKNQVEEVLAKRDEDEQQRKMDAMRAKR